MNRDYHRLYRAREPQTTTELQAGLESLAFQGSCIGHGGVTYASARAGKPTPAPLLSLETDDRFGREDVRPDRGKNGDGELTFCTDNKVALSVIDWMDRLRHRCVLAPAVDGVPKAVP